MRCCEGNKNPMARDIENSSGANEFWAPLHALLPESLLKGSPDLVNTIILNPKPYNPFKPL